MQHPIANILQATAAVLILAATIALLLGFKHQRSQSSNSTPRPQRFWRRVEFAAILAGVACAIIGTALQN